MLNRFMLIAFLMTGMYLAFSLAIGGSDFSEFSVWGGQSKSNKKPLEIGYYQQNLFLVMFAVIALGILELRLELRRKASSEEYLKRIAEKDAAKGKKAKKIKIHVVGNFQLVMLALAVVLTVFLLFWQHVAVGSGEFMAGFAFVWLLYFYYLIKA